MTFTFPYNQIITAEIKKLLGQAGSQWPPILPVDQYFERLADFSIRGKMVRSNLVILAWLAYQKTGVSVAPEATTLAAIQELSESGILMQDDVLDDDLLRRGQPTIHLQYQAVAQKLRPELSAVTARKFGESWATILGDMLYFYLFSLLSRLPIAAECRLALIELYGEELTTTGSGQLGDLATGFGVIEPTEAQVREINRQKTSHYTICLPLLAGAILAHQSGEELENITAVGETIGEIFQLTDDRLDLFSPSTVSGKTQASDVKSGRKTLLYFFTLEGLKGSAADVREFVSLYGKPDLTPRDVTRVQELVKISGGFDRSEALIAKLADEAKSQLSLLSITDEARLQLSQFVDFLISRKH